MTAENAAERAKARWESEGHPWPWSELASSFRASLVNAVDDNEAPEEFGIGVDGDGVRSLIRLDAEDPQPYVSEGEEAWSL